MYTTIYHIVYVIIHKPGNPIRPIVSFYDTPLSALHKQLSEVLKPLTLSDIRLKNSEDFLNKFKTHTDPEYSYYCSLDVKSLYTTCDMRKAVDTVMERLYKDPSILPPTITPEAIKSLLIFSLDNAYCEFDNKFYKQISGGPMGSPLTVTLAEIRVTDIEQQALSSSTRKPKQYYHFVVDGLGYFINRTHAEEFLQHLNSLAPDLEYTIDYPNDDGSIPFLDILIHSDNSTSIYRKPTNTNLYTHYSCATTMSSKESVVRTLTRCAYKLCSPHHLDDELQHLEVTFLSNGYPLQKIRQLMHTTIDRAKSNSSKSQSHTDSNLVASIPYFKSSASSLKKSLTRYDVSTSFHSNTNLKSLLSHTKSATPVFNVKNVIYKIPCGDCNQFYIGQTSRPLIKRIKEHEACFRLNNHTDSSTGNIKSAPVKHGRDNGHRISWKSTSILTTSDTKGQRNLLEHAAISTLKPDMNIQHKGPSVNSCWNPLLPNTSTFKDIPANIEI